MSSKKTAQTWSQKAMARLCRECYRKALSESIKAGIRHKRELKAKQLNHD
jgi:hypothetical protein